MVILATNAFLRTGKHVLLLSQCHIPTLTSSYIRITADLPSQILYSGVGTKTGPFKTQISKYS